jgi:glycine cleavage system H protein
MNFPTDLKYTSDHEWVKLEGNIATIGITDFAQRELGDIVYVDINTLGKEVNQHGVFGTVEAVKTVSDLFMPVSGKIMEINKKLDTDPELVNTDPYGDGWMVKIEVASTADTETLLSADAYKAQVGA